MAFMQGTPAIRTSWCTRAPFNPIHQQIKAPATFLSSPKKSSSLIQTNYTSLNRLYVTYESALLTLLPNRQKSSRLRTCRACASEPRVLLPNRPVNDEDVILKCLSANAEVSVMVIVGSRLISEAQRRHQTSPTATAALGRLLLGTALFGAMKGPDEVVQISFSCRGPITQMIAVANNSGMVKGYASNSLIDVPLNSKGKLDVATAVGPGLLTVVRSHPAWSSPFTGTIPIQTGEIAEDLAHYLAESEQVNSALGLGVSIGRDGLLESGGGFLVQVLPGCSEEILIHLERNIGSLPPMSEAVKSMSALEIAQKILQGIGMAQMDGAAILRPSFGPCSVDELKPRMMRAVESLSAKDIRELLSEQGKVEVRCEFCAEAVGFTELDLRNMLSEKEG